MAFTVDPEPTDEEMAAILVAYEALRPRPSAGVTPEPAGRWRFASRPWARRPAYRGWR